MLRRLRSVEGTSIVEALVGFCLLGLIACLTAKNLSWTTRTLGHSYKDYLELKALYDLSPKEISSNCSLIGEPQYLSCTFGADPTQTLKIITE